MSPRGYANQYRQTAVSSAVLDASPHQLVSLMLAGARERAQLAIACLERGDLPRKVKAIHEAATIIGGLDGSLDHNAGGDIASGLAALYDYAQRRLVDANVNNDAAPLAEIDSLLADIESAWNAINPEASR